MQSSGCRELRGAPYRKETLGCQNHCVKTQDKHKKYYFLSRIAPKYTKHVIYRNLYLISAQGCQNDEKRMLKESNQKDLRKIEKKSGRAQEQRPGKCCRNISCFGIAFGHIGSCCIPQNRFNEIALYCRSTWPHLLPTTLTELKRMLLFSDRFHGNNLTRK